MPVEREEVDRGALLDDAGAEEGRGLERRERDEWRARLRLEGKLALNRAKLSEARNLYAIGDVEYYAPLGTTSHP